MTFTSCPVPHTCPTIDAVIEALKACADKLDKAQRDFNQMTPDEVNEDLAAVKNDLRDLFDSRTSYLEEIRSANARLREWGTEMEKKAEDLENELRDIQEG